MNTTNPALPGFRPFLRKEMSEWWQRRAIIATFGFVTLLGTLATLATRIDELAGGLAPGAAQLDPTMNVLGAGFDQLILYAALFTSIGLLIGERSTGTLAWTLSKPISRNALLLAKWLVAVVMLTVFGLVLPMAVSVGVATWSYGSLPDLGRVATLGGVLITLPAFYVALNLFLSTRLNSQAGVAAIGVGVAVIPLLFAGFLPLLVELWPTSMSAVAMAMAGGETPHLPTILSWSTVVVGLGIAGLVIFQREDM
jgi:ABC-type transport system involved in multi-copper enzyme maturation permease subunit